MFPLSNCFTGFIETRNGSPFFLVKLIKNFLERVLDIDSVL
ncbi:hypothetical protein LEP1GSC083_1165 [Leptospira interrogans serovar Pyrogenes str. L0374]|uniref:Uncharacterized protein n=2 Tax=Leptospira interrogans TaxID=173 RepID=M6K7Y4_LEPIR|nr:hypothetical protein LEP1GSC083_1165 [Leptospira interrogans serovar Pyrogenes str. L0374]EMY22489.1 hypothetical protein LEP1GSC115_0559 [Leptospira interrogans serovar Australis str. 200703203]